MNIKKESLKVRQKDFKDAAKHVAGTYIEKGNFKKVMDLLKFLGKKVTVDKSDISKATYTFEQFRGKLDEKSVSKQQQKFMGMVRAVQKGEMDAPSPEVAQAAKTMKKKDVKDFAKTKHKGLPDKVKEATDQVNQDFPNTLESLDETTIKDIKDILTTIGSSKNMDQAVQMVMKKYKVPQGQAKAMVKKAIDSGVTYDKIKKKYAKESVNEESRLKAGDKVQTPQGTVEIKDRDTRGMRGTQDKYEMILTMKDGKKVSMGSHPQPTATAVKNIAKRHFSKGIPKYFAHNVIESVELEEKDLRKMDHDTFMKYGDENPRGRADPAWNAERKRRYRNDQSRMYRRMKKESVELEEKRDAGKSATGYDIYHDTYSAAMQHAYAHAKKKHGVTVRPSEIDDKVASGPRKPSTGKTVSHILKTDKKQNLHVQVYNTGRKYELNMYVESVELDENQTAFTRKELEAGNITIRKDKNGWRYLVNKSKSGAMGPYRTDAQVRTAIMKIQKESVELDEAPKVPAGMKFIAGYEYKDANGNKHSHTHYRKGKKMTDPVVVHIDGKEWKTFQSFTKAKQAAISHIKSMKESVELDEANAIDLARDVVKNKGAKKGLDMQTANAILTVYDKVNDANKKKMEKMPVAKLASAVWKILGKAK